MPFCGNVSHSAMRKLVIKAVRRGEAWDGNRHVYVRGDVQVFDTFVGPFYKTDGTIECRYYGKPVFVVDFANKRVTDNGYNAYNSCTRKTINGYENALFELFGFDLPKNKIKYTYYRWMGWRETSARFLSRMSWFKFDRSPWFYWDLYDERDVEPYDESIAFLSAHQNWRWFTYDWDEHGKWSRKFIDAAAEQRYRQREKRWQRISKSTKTSSSTPSTKAEPPMLLMPLSGSSTQSATLRGTEATLSTLG